MATKSPAKAGADRRPRARLTVKRVGDALRKHSGIQSHAAEALGVNRSTVCKFVQAHPELNDVIEDVAAEDLDLAKGNLRDFLAGRIGDAGQRWNATKFYLENKGQAIGYGVRKMAFSDGEGNVMAPGVLVVPVRELDGDAWEAKHAPQPPAEDAAPE